MGRGLRGYEIVLGFLVATALWASVEAWQSSRPPEQTTQQHAAAQAPRKEPPNLTEAEKADERLARYTLWLTIFTGVLAVSTVGLGVATWLGIRNQRRDTEILQRAYISVLPKGVKPYESGDGLLSCEVLFKNAGNLPATRVQWILKRDFSKDPSFVPPSVSGEKFSGNNIIPPRGEMRKGTRAISSGVFDVFKSGGIGDDRWLYVWGRVSYLDGFGKTRFTDFCHRYNMHGQSSRTLPEERGRHHEHGNHTDEDVPVYAWANQTLPPVITTGRMETGPPPETI